MAIVEDDIKPFYRSRFFPSADSGENTRALFKATGKTIRAACLHDELLDVLLDELPSRVSGSHRLLSGPRRGSADEVFVARGSWCDLDLPALVGRHETNENGRSNKIEVVLEPNFRPYSLYEQNIVGFPKVILTHGDDAKGVGRFGRSLSLGVDQKKTLIKSFRSATDKIYDEHEKYYDLLDEYGRQYDDEPLL